MAFSPLRTKRFDLLPGVEPGDPSGLGTLSGDEENVAEAVAVEAALEVEVIAAIVLMS